MVTARRTRSKARYTQEVHVKVVQLSGLTPEQAADRRHLVNRLDFQDRLGAFLVREIGAYQRGSRFADEKCPLPAPYPEVYAPKSVAQQVQMWRKPFSNLRSYDRSIAKIALPRGAESYFVAPHPRHLADSYPRSLFKILGAIPALPREAHQRMGVANFRPCEDTCAMLGRIANEQRENDFIVFPGQLGALHPRSVRSAREQFATGASGEAEFGVDALLLAAMLLPHPERLAPGRFLDVCSSGDEQVTVDKERAQGALTFTRSETRTEYYISSTHQEYDDVGIATAFLVPR